MPNTTPIPELQALELVRRLYQITRENDYAFDVSQVSRLNREGDSFEFRHLSIRVDDAGKERLTDADCAGNPPAIAWEQTHLVRCFCRNSNTPADPDYETNEAYQVNVSTMADAAILAITTEAADPSMWYTMAGNCFDVQFGSFENFSADDGEYHGVSIPIICRYRVSENNPFEIRA